MDTFDNEPSLSQMAARRPGPSDLVWNTVTILILIAILGTSVMFFVVYTNHDAGMNLFTAEASSPSEAPPAAAPAGEIPPTSTPVAPLSPTCTATTIPLPPTETQIPTNEPTNIPALITPVFNPNPNSTPEPSATPEGIGFPGYPFEVRGTPAVVDASIMRPDQSCDWMGVAGQVFDLQLRPLVGMIVQLGGKFGAATVNQQGLSGTALQYGVSGYEFTLADHPSLTREAMWVQLFDQAGLALSDKVYFNTYEDCQKNLILINFKQVR
jgi:hypothetical protein